MRFVADLHIHSKYSRATSPEMELNTLALWAKRKGIHLLGTGDFTHPDWLRELQEQLQPDGSGLYQYGGVHFLLTTEVNNLFYRQGVAKTIHNLLFVPTLEAATRVNRVLNRYGNLAADGRPTVSLDARDMVKLLLDVEPQTLIIPAHAWTPWFSLFGSHSGFDALEACFQDETERIYAIETGLSSDPAMNWRLSSLDRVSLISNSDSHSPSRIGREANVFDCELHYAAIAETLRTHDVRRLIGTIEFFPAEGKYHFDGHRKCQVRWSPAETRAQRGVCSGCGRKVTVGVMHRVEMLADRPADFTPPHAPIVHHLIPLDEIVADALGVGKQSASVEREYLNILQRLGPELDILLHVPAELLTRSCPPKIAEGILRVREGRVHIAPGYDGAYGTIELFGQDAPALVSEQQMELF